jgi:ribosomal protein S26
MSHKLYYRCVQCGKVYPRDLPTGAATMVTVDLSLEESTALVLAGRISPAQCLRCYRVARGYQGDENSGTWIAG